MIRPSLAELVETPDIPELHSARHVRSEESEASDPHSFGFIAATSMFFTILDTILLTAYNQRDECLQLTDPSQSLALDRIIRLDESLNDWEANLPDHLRAPVRGIHKAASEYAQQANVLRQR